MARTSLLTAIDSTSHIHLIIGSNSLAGARCARSLEVGAKPLLIAPDTSELHFSLQKRIESKELRWIARPFEDEDLFRLGREEIGRVVDVVFITLKPRDPISK
jgi:uroporphyrin-III C-methyltransferase